MELKPKGFIKTSDGARLSDEVAPHDRAARGTYLLALWLANRDVKDNNSKTYFVKRQGDIVGYQEGQHDLGFALGSMLRSGEVNRFDTGSDFARAGLLGQNNRFHQAQFFKPEAWRSATWADSRWMAQRIVAISEKEIRQAVSYSLWPDFVQDALVYKLIDRQNTVRRLYGMTESLSRCPPEPPSKIIPLGNSGQIRAVEEKYRLPVGSLSAELTARRTGPGYVETILDRGQIARAKESALISLLEKHRFPSGLSRRYSRVTD
ncbi:MAG: hypothetical protein ABL994_17555 [Verrucomicrobiales bacterium]